MVSLLLSFPSTLKDWIGCCFAAVRVFVAINNNDRKDIFVQNSLCDSSFYFACISRKRRVPNEFSVVTLLICNFGRHSIGCRKEPRRWPTANTTPLFWELD